jgi:hypothetical protein
MPLTATNDTTWASVKLSVDLSGVSSPWFVTITRKNNVTGELAKVRSADLTAAGGGILLAYDHECPLGVSCTYSAQAYTAVGAATGSPATATVTTPNVTDGGIAWLKSIDNPSLSLSLRVFAAGFLGRRNRTQEFQVINRTNPVVQSFGLSGRKGPIEVTAKTWATIDAAVKLFNEKQILVQFAPTSHIPDLYAAVGDVQPLVFGPRSQQFQRFQVDLTEIDRPSTTNDPLRIPGVSWTSQAATFATYTAAAAARTSWSDYADG